MSSLTALQCLRALKLGWCIGDPPYWLHNVSGLKQLTELDMARLFQRYGDEVFGLEALYGLKGLQRLGLQGLSLKLHPYKNLKCLPSVKAMNVAFSCGWSKGHAACIAESQQCGLQEIAVDVKFVSLPVAILSAVTKLMLCGGRVDEPCGVSSIPRRAAEQLKVLVHNISNLFYRMTSVR